MVVDYLRRVGDRVQIGEHIGDVRQFQQDWKAEADAWQGFQDPPPYPADFVDGLWNQVRAKNREIEALRAEQGVVQTLSDVARADFKASERTLRQAAEQLEKVATAGPLC